MSEPIIQVIQVKARIKLSEVTSNGGNDFSVLYGERPMWSHGSVKTVVRV